MFNTQDDLFIFVAVRPDVKALGSQESRELSPTSKFFKSRLESILQERSWLHGPIHSHSAYFPLWDYSLRIDGHLARVVTFD